MPDVFSPISDVTATNITGMSNNTVGQRYQNVDETVVDDADYIYSANGTVGVFEVLLPSMTDPVNRTGFIVNYRHANMNAGVLSGTAFATVTCDLYQGGTLIASETRTSSAAWLTSNFALTNLQTNAITDFSNLRIRITTSNTSSRGIGISYLSLTMPSYVAPTEENLITFSEDLSNSAWTKNLITVSSTLTNSPSIDGSVSARKIVPNATSSTAHAVIFVRTGSNETICFSFFARASGYNFLLFGFENAAATNSVARAVANISTGEITLISANNVDFTNNVAVLTDFGGGWFLCSISTNKGSVNTTVSNRIYVFTASTTIAYAGDLTSGAEIWGIESNHGTVRANYIKRPTPTRKQLASLGVG